VFARLLSALLVALVLFAGATPASAQTDVPTPDPGAGADPLSTNSDYDVVLNQRILTFRQTVSAWQQEGTTLAAQATALKSRITRHNTVVNAYPGRQAPPAVAARLNAEAATLNAEQDNLRAQYLRWAGRATALEDERLGLLRAIAHFLQTERAMRPPYVPRISHAGDTGRRRQGRGPDGKYTSGNGGDTPSRHRESAALDGYAADHGVTVDKRQFNAYLSPDTLNGLAAGSAEKLRLYRRYDGLVLKPDGRYKALEVKTNSARLEAGQREFDDAIVAGGTATVLVDGQVRIIDEVEVVPG
jgi:hypothetical protein